MGSLMQLMALPAACMLFAWMGRGGANAIASLLCKLVAMMAVSDNARARVGCGTGPKAVKAARTAGSRVAIRKSAPKEGRTAHNPAPPRSAIVDPVLRMRRLRPRLAAGSAGI
jgi:hypothetical protein